ncbi:MAG: pyruvate kinase alpha/beta domain-containing protein, partial [Thermofilaceae archaeon]
MTVKEKTIVYFTEPGPGDTEDVIKAVARRISEGGIDTVVVASTSGRTGVKFAEALKSKVKVIAVSHEKMNSEFKQKISELGGVAVDETHLPLHGKDMDDVREAFYALGQGFKVAVEVILIAADLGIVKHYQDVTGIGG